MTLTDTAKQIRATLKKNGMTAKKVSVRKSRGSAVNVVIKDAFTSSKRVKDLVRGFERVDRCAYSGEILSGGNTFVFVRYADDLFAAETAALKARFEARESFDYMGFEVYPVFDGRSDDKIVWWTARNMLTGEETRMEFAPAEQLPKVVADSF